MDFSCRKFQPNIFNKSRCQNCFKPREQHLSSEEELQQVKAIYGGWLCLAPDGTDFSNPIHRSRKWQRRFFILYEDGRLQFSLDESPGTVPQGMLDLSLCSEVTDAEGRTGQKNALFIITPEQETFIRGDSKEIINSWSEQLIVFQKKQNHRKKSEVSSVQFQEKVLREEAECGSGASDMGAVVYRDPCGPEHEDDGAVDFSTACDDDDDYDEDEEVDDEDSLVVETVKNRRFYQQSCSVDSEEDSASPSPEPWGTDPDPFCLNSSLPRSASILPRFASSLSGSSSSEDWELDEDLESTADLHQDSCFINSSMINGDGVLVSKVCQCCRRRGRSRSQTCTIINYNNKEDSTGGLAAPQIFLHPQRRARSVDGWGSDSTVTPDLLNFKQGYLLFLDDNEQWRRYWSVLSAHSLRFYSDSGLEEASELVEEIDLTSCHEVTELSVQTNYGFQLHSNKLVYTLAAMNAGIRQNWIQVLLEKIQNRNAPDVTSVADDQVILQVKAQRGPDVTQDSRLSSSRRAGPGAETSDWTEIRQIRHPELQDLQSEEQQEEPESRIQSRRRRREERRQRYELVMASSGLPVEDRTSQEHQDQEQRMMEIEERWLQVEKISIREGKKVLLFPERQSSSSADLEDVVEPPYQRTNSTNETQSHEIPCKAEKMISPNMQNHISALTDKYLQTKQLLQLENLKRQHLKTQLSSEVLTEAELKPVCRALGCETALSESRPGSHGWREASRDREDERSESRVNGFGRGHAVALLRKQNVGSDPAVVEQLEAVNRHNQELLNQLAEANREIDRLKEELLCHQMNCSQPGLESVVESLKVELPGNSRELEVVQNHLAEVEEKLKEAQKTLQLREATLKSLGFVGEDCDDTLLILSLSSTSDSSSEELRTEDLARIGQCEQDLENHNLDQNVDQNALLTESSLLNSLETTVAEAAQWETLEETNNQEFQDVWRSSDGFLEEDVAKKRVQMRSNNLKMLLEIIRPLTTNWPNGEQNSLSDSDILQLERNFWNDLINALKQDQKYLSKSIGTKQAGSLVKCVQKKLDEIRMDLLALIINANNPQSQTSDSDQHDSNTFPNSNYLSNFDNTGLHNGSMEDHHSVQKFRTVLVDEHLDNHPIWRGLKHHIEKKLALLNHVELASKLEPSTVNSPTNWAVCNQTEDSSSKGLDPLVSAAMDIFMACLVGYGDAQNQEKTVNSIDKEFNSSIKGVDLYDGTLLQPNNMAAQENSRVNEENETETMNSLRSRIKELEIQLSNSEEQKASLQQQHEEDQTNLKAVYEQGFTMLKKSHQKLIEDLLLQHHREKQRLLEEKDRLLDEEAAATRTVIAALNRAHSSEMERVQQKTNCEKSNCDANIADILKNHREELASVQRELEVLSVQFSQKCLENVHLAQALEAERKALQHCQHQNLALSTCNQDKNLVPEESGEIQSGLGVVKERAEEQTGYLRENLRPASEALSESEEEKTLLNS